MHPRRGRRRGPERRHRGGPWHARDTASAAGRVPGGTGRAMRLLPVRHPDRRQGAARLQSGPVTNRDRRGARPEPLPLRRAQPHHARRRARRRGAPRDRRMIRNTLPQSLADNPRLDSWIGFEPGGRVRVSVGKVELGQGSPTGLVQIAAEELDVEPGRLRLVSGDTDATPNEGYTAGSRSIELSGGALRLVCAEIRALFLEAAAGRLGCPMDELSVRDGRFLRAGHESGLDYWALADAVDLGRDATGNAPTKRPADYRVV